MMERVRKASGRLKLSWALRRPLLELTLLREVGVGFGLEWAMQACQPGVVTVELLDEVRVLEEELLRHVFAPLGDLAASVDDIAVGLAELPGILGGLGVRRVRSHGEIRDGLWEPYSKEDREARYVALHDDIRDRLRAGGDRARLQRLDECRRCDDDS